MKCLSCENEIPDVSTICPFCGSGVTPIKPLGNVQSENTSQIEDLEQTQLLETVSNENLEETLVLDNVILDNASETKEQASENAQVSIEDAPILYQTPDNTPNVSEDLIVDANPLNQDPILGNGEKIANVAPTPTVEKKKKPIFIIIGAIVLVALMGVIFFLYTTLFKSADKRVDSVLNGIFQFANLNNQKIEEKASGTLKLKTDMTFDKETIKGTLESKYAYDFKQKLMDVSMTLSEASYNDTSFIGAEPLKLQTYLYDKKAYVLLPNFYENYIYDTIDNYDELFDSIYKEDVQYQVILNGIKNALKSGVQATTKKQTVEEKTIGKAKERVNVISIALTEANQKKFVNAFFNQLKNNTKFLEECAKLGDSTIDELKDSLDEAKEEIEYTKTNAQIEIYTSTFGTAFKGIMYHNGSESIALYPEGKNYVIDGKIAEANFHLVITNTIKNTKTEKNQNLKVEFDVNTLKENHTLKGIVEIEEASDKEPKVEKVNTKNSVEASRIPEVDRERILNNIMQYGNFKSLFEGIAGNVPGQSITPTIPQITIPESGSGV